MTLIWAEDAIADLGRIRTYIAEHNPQAANAMALRLLQAAELLLLHPQMGLKTLRPDIRRLVVSHSAYSLIYRIVDANIEIIEVFDGRMLQPRTAPEV